MSKNKQLTVATHKLEIKEGIIVLADINFPVRRICKGSNAPIEVRADGLGIAELLEAILKLMPLDTYQKEQAIVMLSDEDLARLSTKTTDRQSFNKYTTILQGSPEYKNFAALNRLDFYERVKNVYAIVQTGDMTPYANILIKRGVIND